MKLVNFIPVAQYNQNQCIWEEIPTKIGRNISAKRCSEWELGSRTLLWGIWATRSQKHPLTKNQSPGKDQTRMETQNQEQNSYTDPGTAQNDRFWFDLWIQEGSGVLSVCKRAASLLVFPAGALVFPTPTRTRLPRHDMTGRAPPRQNIPPPLGQLEWVGLGFQFLAAQPHAHYV